MRPVAFLLCCCFFVTVQAQTSYYVSPDGSNAGDGSMASPWLTVQFGLEHIVPGDTLNLREGIYTEKIAIPFSGITLRSMPGETAVIDAGIMAPQDAAIEIYHISDITIEGLEIRNNVRNNAQGILIEGYGDHFTIRNCVIHDIHFSADPDDNATPSKNAQGIIVYGTHPSIPITNLLITDNEVYNCRLGYSEGIAVNGNVDGFEVSHNYVHDLTNIGIDIIGHEGTCSTDSLDQARNGKVLRNTVHDCLSAYATSGGLYADGPRDVLFEHNISYRNGYGIEVGCENAGTVADNITIRNNLFYNNEVAALAMGGYNYPSSGKVTHAVFRNNSTLKNDFLEEGYGEIYLSYCEDCVLENNIFYNSNQQIMLYAELEQPGIIFDHNLFYHDGASSSQYFEWNGNVYAGLAEFQSSSGTNTHSLFADPLYLSSDTAAANLHTEGSAAYNKGNPETITDVLETDLDDQPRVLNDTIDCGAYEYYSEPVGIADLQSSILIYPNPAHQFIHLEAHSYISARMYDESGKIIGFWQPVPQQIPTDKLLPGYYLLVLDNGLQWHTFPVVVE